jgi:hypothetical protein
MLLRHAGQVPIASGAEQHTCVIHGLQKRMVLASRPQQGGVSSSSPVWKQMEHSSASILTASAVVVRLSRRRSGLASSGLRLEAAGPSRRETITLYWRRACVKSCVAVKLLAVCFDQNSACFDPSFCAPLLS